MLLVLNQCAETGNLELHSTFQFQTDSNYVYTFLVFPFYLDIYNYECFSFSKYNWPATHSQSAFYNTSCE